MSVFHAHYGCHEGALVMRKSDGEVYRARGNVSLWDMTAILVPHEPAPSSLLEEWDGTDTRDWICVKSDEFKRDWLVLDEGADKLSEALSAGLRNLVR